MADAQATFAVVFDTSSLQAGAKAGDAALARQAASIKAASKELDGLKAAQKRLLASASVKQYIAQQKAIEAAQRKANVLKKKLVEAKESRDIASQANVEPEAMQKLIDDVNRYEGAVAEARAEVERLEEAQSKLASEDAGVKAYKDKESIIGKKEDDLADLQTKYDRAGGSAEGLGEKLEVPKEGIQGVLEKAKSAGGPIGDMATKLESLGKVAKKGGWAVILAVIVAITVALIKASIAAAKFALTSADASAKTQRARQSAAFGSLAGAKDIESTMRSLRQETALSKQEAQDLAVELYRAGDRGSKLDETALTIARFKELGDDAADSVKGLYETLRQPAPSIGGVVNNRVVITKDQLPRDVFLELANQLGKDGNKALLTGFTADKEQIRKALARIGEQRFAGPAAQQMATLEKLSERVKENLQSLFDGLYIGRFLGGLQKLVMLLDDTSETGKAVRTILTAIAEPIANAFEKALPYIEVFFDGLIFGALIVTLYAIKIKNALSNLIPGSFTKNIDWMETSFRIGIAVVVAFSLVLGLLATALFLAALPIALIVVAFALLAYGAVLAYDAIVGLFQGISNWLEGFSLADAIGSIIDGIVLAITENASKVWDAFKGLAKGGLDAFKGALGIKSPSLAFRLAGREIPRGVALGVEDEAPAAQDATASMVSPEVGGATAAAGSRSGHTLHIGTIIISGVQSAEQLTDEFFDIMLGRALSRVSLEGGALPEPEGAQ